MTGLDRDTSKSPDRTGVCCTGRCAPSQCETITGPSFSSLNKPDQERTPAYRDSSGSESPSGCLLCYFFRNCPGSRWPSGWIGRTGEGIVKPVPSFERRTDRFGAVSGGTARRTRAPARPEQDSGKAVQRWTEQAAGGEAEAAAPGAFEGEPCAKSDRSLSRDLPELWFGIDAGDVHRPWRPPGFRPGSCRIGRMTVWRADRGPCRTTSSCPKIVWPRWRTPCVLPARRWAVPALTVRNDHGDGRFLIANKPDQEREGRLGAQDAKPAPPCLPRANLARERGVALQRASSKASDDGGTPSRPRHPLSRPPSAPHRPRARPSAVDASRAVPATTFSYVFKEDALLPRQPRRALHQQSGRAGRAHGEAFFARLGGAIWGIPVDKASVSPAV